MVGPGTATVPENRSNPNGSGLRLRSWAEIRCLLQLQPPPNGHWYRGLGVRSGDFEGWTPQKVGGCGWSRRPQNRIFEPHSPRYSLFLVWGCLRTKNGRHRPLHLLPGIELFMDSRVRSGSAWCKAPMSHVQCTTCLVSYTVLTTCSIESAAMYPLCDIPSGCCSFTGPWTVTRSSLRMLRRVAAFCRPLRPVLLLVSFPRSRSPVVGVLGLC